MVLSVGSELTEDKQALLAFLSNTPHANRVQWNASVSTCNWVGVECDPNLSFVHTLRLPSVGLVGPIPPNTLGKLSQLRVLSLRSNRLSGQFPSDFSNLTLLRDLYLQDNEFSGEFPASVTGMTRLTRLDLSSNNFTGAIPFTVNNLTHLTGLLLGNNRFSGNLPTKAQTSKTTRRPQNKKTRDPNSKAPTPEHSNNALNKKKQKTEQQQQTGKTTTDCESCSEKRE
ncbi:hypothetical protein EZV62_008931 [Acer yangbiense]|uniref:Leucine-rich repeat-containing N-terminal plant-type domain-containing protein n=1 Tax=Acer yangbiense TaxID=1000413 RepID=A0A5C7IGT0_9ROSI|nr:hypothetical protein EZV62_008931 [Acer yangbiense]